MMAEEHNNADSYDGLAEFHKAVYVWEKTIMINIEGKIQKIIPSQLREVHSDKKNDRGGGGLVTLPCEWGRHCSTVALHLAWRRRTHPSRNGGGRGGVHRGVAQAWHCMSPIPPKEPTLRGMGGGGRGCSPWRRPSTDVREKSKLKMRLTYFW